MYEQNAATPKKRRRTTRNILREEDYMDLLQTIIERDFFPDLYRLRFFSEKLKKEHFSSLRSTFPSNSIYPPTSTAQPQLSSFTSLSRAYEFEKTPNPELKGSESRRRSQKPTAAFSNDIRQVETASGEVHDVDVTKLSLTDFQESFTTEDDASFVDIVTREKQRLALKWHATVEAARSGSNNVVTNLTVREIADLAYDTGEELQRKVESLCDKDPNDTDRRALFGHPAIDDELAARNLLAIDNRSQQEASLDSVENSLQQCGAGESALDKFSPAIPVQTSRHSSVLPGNTRFEDQKLRGPSSMSMLEKASAVPGKKLNDELTVALQLVAEERFAAARKLATNEAMVVLGQFSGGATSSGYVKTPMHPMEEDGEKKGSSFGIPPISKRAEVAMQLASAISRKQMRLKGQNSAHIRSHILKNSFMKSSSIFAANNNSTPTGYDLMKSYRRNLRTPSVYSKTHFPPK